MASALAVFGSLVGFAPASAEAGLVAPAAKCKSVPQNAGTSRARSSMLCFTNYARARKGLKPYRLNGKLNQASSRKAGDILRCNSFSHTACGRGFDFWIKRSGYRGCAIGENIAWGSGSLGSSRQIFKAWMNSSGHRAAILSPDYRHIGIGKKIGRLSGYSGAGVWVQNFGASC